MFNSSGKKQNTTNRISDKSDKNKDEKNTGKVPLAPNEQLFSPKDDIESNNQEEMKDLSKRSKKHFKGDRESINDGHAFAYSSSIVLDYANWEVNDYLDNAFFDPKICPEHTIEDGFTLYFIYLAETFVTALTNFLVKPLALLLSRRISGIKAGDTLSEYEVSGGVFGEDSVKYKPHGYWGWGKIMMISPSTVVDTLVAELTNLSLVAALMLTITLPLVCNPGNNIAQKNYSWLYIFVGGGSIAGQFTTVTSSLAIITNLNKTKVTNGKSGMLFVKSIFNPYFGLVGLIGPMLYIGAIFSWCSTVVMSIVLLVASYEDMGQPNQLWAIYFVMMMVPFGAYFFLQLPLGIAVEIRCAQVEMRQYFIQPDEYLKTHKSE